MKDLQPTIHLLALGLEDAPRQAAEIDFTDIPDGDWYLSGYELLKKIGRGGMGVIYKARQRHSNRLVALKKLHPSTGETPDGTMAVERIFREAEAAASLDHPNILPIYEVGRGQDGLPFYSMKLAGGGSLAEIAKPVEKKRAAIWMLKIARAVQYAHSNGILHRDLKPGNILLDLSGEPLVADFGLAKWMSRPSDLTQANSVFGTPGYLAPEQAEGRAVSFASDVYSMGAVFFELLAGRRPFLGDNAWSVVREAAASPAPLLRSLIPALDRDLETICARCLEADPAARYPAAGDLGDDLQRWLDGRPIVARPAGFMEKGWRWAKRNRTASATGILCVSALTLGAVKQYENGRLAREVRAQVLLSQAVAVLPVLDLDAMNVSSPTASQSTAAIARAAGETGRLLNPGRKSAAWTQPFALEARALRVPYLLVALTRQTENGRRWVLHYYDAKEGAFTRRATSTSTAGGGIPAELTRRILRGGAEVGLPERALAEAGDQTERELVAMGEQYYLQFTSTSLELSISCLRHAIERNPQSVRAHTLLAISLAYRSRMGLGDNLNDARLAGEAAEAAFQLAPADPQVYRAKASVAFIAGHLHEAREAIRTYLEMSLDFEMAAGMSGGIERLNGHPVEALQWFNLGNAFSKNPDFLTQQADVLVEFSWDDLAHSIFQGYTNLFPHKSDGKLGICNTALLQRNFPLARRLAEELARDFPEESYPPMIGGLEALYAHDYPRAVEFYRKLLETDRQGGAFFYGGVSYLAGLGFSLMETGDRAAGEKLLWEARESELRLLQTNHAQPDHLFSLAAVEAALGKQDASLKLLEDNIPVLFTSLRFLNADPRFDRMRNDPRFQQVVRAMSLRMTSLRAEVKAAIKEQKYQ